MSDDAQPREEPAGLNAPVAGEPAQTPETSPIPSSKVPGGKPDAVIVDRYRQIVFPNRLREMRVRHGQHALLPFAASIPEISYIRLSKIERGEVWARADELVRIAHALDIAPRSLLLDVDSPRFDMAAWFAPFAEGAALDDADEARIALLLAAAVRARRAGDPALTAAALDTRFGIPAVILSRLENAQKGLARWNAQTIAALCMLFDVADEAALRAQIAADHAAGRLDPFLAAIPGEAQRIARTRQRVAALDRELSTAAPPANAPAKPAAVRSIPVYGTPLGHGRIARTPAGAPIPAPGHAGPNAFAMRTGPATLGGGLPGQAVVIVDPDRYPQAGGLALVRDRADAAPYDATDGAAGAYRVLSVTVDRAGVLHGYSLNPAFEIALDSLPPADVAAIVAAYFA